MGEVRILVMNLRLQSSLLLYVRETDGSKEKAIKQLIRFLRSNQAINLFLFGLYVP